MIALGATTLAIPTIGKFCRQTWDKTRKTLTLSKEKWIDQVNPVIRGKVNYFLTMYNAIKANEDHGFESSCFFKAFGKELQAIDGYIRQRLRIAMIHDHPSQRKGHAMKTKWNNEFFAIGHIPSYWYYYYKISKGLR